MPPTGASSGSSASQTETSREMQLAARWTLLQSDHELCVHEGSKPACWVIGSLRHLFALSGRLAVSFRIWNKIAARLRTCSGATCIGRQ